MLTVHHLRRSQSERIVWLCEELGLTYALEGYDRDPVTVLAPANYKALHPIGAAPVIQDGDVLLAESGAVMDYILAKYGSGRLVLDSAHPDFATYLYWLHFANGTLQPAMGRNMIVHRLGLTAENPIKVSVRARLDLALSHLEKRVANATFLAGKSFTAADIMTIFSLTTMRIFYSLDLAPWPAIKAYLHRIGERPAYRRAMEKGDPGFTPMLD